MKHILAVSLLILTSFNLQSFGQTISSTYDFNGTQCASYSITMQPANATFSDVSLSNISCLSSSLGILTTQNWTTSTTPDNASYLEFTVTPTAGYRVSLTSFMFKVAINATGPTSVKIAHNATGSFNTSTTFTGLSATYQSLIWTNPGVSLTTSPVTFRIYGFNASAAAGNKQLKINFITLSGSTSLIAKPTLQSTITSSSITSNSVSLSFSGGDGAKRIVLAKSGSAVNSSPVSQTGYTANSVFGAGSQIGTGNYVVYNGSGNAVTVTGLSSSTTYYFAVYEYNDGGGVNTQNYLTNSPGTTNILTGTGYTWNGSISTDWTTAANWTPSRSASSTSDILTFNSGGSVSVTNIPTQTIGQLIISGSTNVSLNGSAANTLTTNGFSGTDIYVAAGSSLSIGTTNALTLNLRTSNNTLIADGDIYISNAGSQIKGPGQVTINGNFYTTNANGFSGIASTSIANSITSLTLAPASGIIYNGPSSQTVTTATAYPNVTFSNAGTKTLNNNLIVTGNISITSSAVLNPQTYNVTLGGNWNSYGAAGFSESTGSVIFNGTSAQTITGTGGELFSNLTIASSGGVSLASAAQVTNILTLTSGTLTSGGLLTLDLDQSKIDGSGSGTISGAITVSKFVNAIGHHYLGVPLNGVTGNDMNDDTQVINPATHKTRLFYYVGPGYTGITNLNTVLTPFIGYDLYFIAGSTTLDYTGTYTHTASYSSNFSNSSSAFQLVGNPYPSALDWNAASGWTKTGINNAIYIWNAATNSYSSYVNGSSTNGGTQYIPSMQGFFVQTSGSGGTATVGVTNSVRTTSSNPVLFRTASPDALRIQLSGNGYSDETVLQFSDEATHAFDSDLDAGKLMNPDLSPSIYTSLNQADYSINTIPASGSTIVPLTITCPAAGSYSVSFTGNAAGLTLLDLKTGTETPIVSGSTLAITVDPSSATAKYALKYANTNGTISSETNIIYSFEKTIYLSGFTSSIEYVDVLDVAGNVIMHVQGTNTDMIMDANSLKAGLYIIKASSAGNVTSRKIIIN